MRPKVHGHRGARAQRPENTIAAFQYAIAARVDAIEMDLVTTRENVIVISHDPVTEPTDAPTLDEVLALASTGIFEFNLEIKIYSDSPSPGQFARQVLDKIHESNLEDRVIVQSFNFETLRALRSRAPKIKLSAITENDQRDFATIAREANAEMVSPNLCLITCEKVRSAHDQGIKILAWTANTTDEWTALIKAQVDAIITDDPEALIRFLDSCY